jgi:hypothetical protein
VLHLVHLSLGLDECGAVISAMIGLTIVKHAVRRSKCVWASAVIWCATSLIVLSESQIGGPWVSFLWRWAKILLPIL